MAVKKLMLVFWVVTPCGLAGIYQYFRETYSSAPKMKTACFFEMLVSTYKPTLRYNPEDQQ
jgi:hypothetical protein